MSDPVPLHLVPEVEEYHRGGFYGDTDRKYRLFADLIVANAVPANLDGEVQQAITDAWLSPAGDVLRHDEVDDDFF